MVIVSDKVFEWIFVLYGSSLETNISIDVIYLGYFFVFYKSHFFYFFCLRNLRFFYHSYTWRKNNKTFFIAILGIWRVIIYFTVDLN